MRTGKPVRYFCVRIMAKRNREDNLVRFDEMPTEQRKALNRKGGINSGIAKRRKKAIKESLKAMLEAGVVSDDAVEVLANAVGSDGSGMTNYDAVAAAIMLGAIKGNPTQQQMILDLFGESSAEKRANAAARRDKKRLEMEVADFEQRHAGNTVDNDRVLAYIEGMTSGSDTAEPETDRIPGESDAPLES